MLNWIKISAIRNPKQDQDVLIVRNNPKVEVARATLVNDKIEFRDFCGRTNYPLSGITHWREFPSFP